MRASCSRGSRSPKKTVSSSGMRTVLLAACTASTIAKPKPRANRWYRSGLFFLDSHLEDALKYRSL
jgi:hypothetical protein